jgi:hypothetical protein
VAQGQCREGACAALQGLVRFKGGAARSAIPMMI